MKFLLPKLMTMTMVHWIHWHDSWVSSNLKAKFLMLIMIQITQLTEAPILYPIHVRKLFLFWSHSLLSFSNQSDSLKLIFFFLAIKTLSLKSFLQLKLKGRMILKEYEKMETVNRSALCSMIIYSELENNENYK